MWSGEMREPRRHSQLPRWRRLWNYRGTSRPGDQRGTVETQHSSPHRGPLTFRRHTRFPPVPNTLLTPSSHSSQLLLWILSFQECQRNGIIRYVTFRDWPFFTLCNSLEIHLKRASVVRSSFTYVSEKKRALNSLCEDGSLLCVRLTLS